MLTAKKKAKAITKVARHEKDTGSPEVQISILSERIEELASHLKVNKKDNHSRRGLLGMISDRRRHLKYLSKNDPKKYNKIVKDLSL
jgi:small subunit ribosomal protein S15